MSIDVQFIPCHASRAEPEKWISCTSVLTNWVLSAMDLIFELLKKGRKAVVYQESKHLFLYNLFANKSPLSSLC